MSIRLPGEPRDAIARNQDGDDHRALIAGATVITTGPLGVTDSGVRGADIGTVVHYADAPAVDTVFIDGTVEKWGGTRGGCDVDAVVRVGKAARAYLLEGHGISSDALRRGPTSA